MTLQATTMCPSTTPYHCTHTIDGEGLCTIYQTVSPERGEGRFALKVYPNELAQDRLFRHRLTHAAQRARELDHPAIVPVFDLAQMDGQLFVDQAWIDSLDLGLMMQYARLRSMWPTPRIAAQIGLIICAALDHVHRQGMVHGSLAPWNVLIHPRGQLFLTDVGLGQAALAPGCDLVPRARRAYLSPERIRGAGPSVASDLHACGLLLYELLTAHTAQWTDDEEEAIDAVVLAGEIPHLRVARRGIDPVLAAAVMRALAPDPAQRYDSARAFAAALQPHARPSSRDQTLAAYVRCVLPEQAAQVAPFDRNAAHCEAVRRLQFSHLHGRHSLLPPVPVRRAHQVITSQIDVVAMGLVDEPERAPDEVTSPIDVVAMGLLDELEGAPETTSGLHECIPSPQTDRTSPIDVAAMGLLDDEVGLQDAVLDRIEIASLRPARGGDSGITIMPGSSQAREAAVLAASCRSETRARRAVDTQPLPADLSPTTPRELHALRAAPRLGATPLAIIAAPRPGATPPAVAVASTPGAVRSPDTQPIIDARDGAAPRPQSDVPTRPSIATLGAASPDETPTRPSAATLGARLAAAPMQRPQRMVRPPQPRRGPRQAPSLVRRAARRARLGARMRPDAQGLTQRSQAAAAACLLHATGTHAAVTLPAPASSRPLSVRLVVVMLMLAVAAVAYAVFQTS